MLIPKEYDTPDSDSLCDPFEFPPDIPDGVTYGDLASHISNVVENITLHAASKVEGTPHPADQSCFNANGQPFDPPNIASPDSNPYSTPAKENSSLPQYVFRKHGRVKGRSLSDSIVSGSSGCDSLRQQCHHQTLRHYHSLSCFLSGVLRRCSYSADPLSPLMLGDSGSHITTDNLKPSGGTVIENRVTPTCILQCNSSGLPKTFSKNPDKDSEKGLSYMRPHSRQNHIREEELPQDYTSYPSDGEDEFGDFATFSSALAPTAEQPSVDYGNTSQPENDDFADFSSFTGQQATEVHSSLTSRSLVGNLLTHLGSALEQAFNVDSEANIKDFSNSTLVDFPPSQFWDCNPESPTNRLWRELTEHPSSFLYVWKESFTYSRYLQTVGVDLRSSRFLPPLSGGLLQLLEPTPIASKVNKAPSGRSASPTSASSSQSSQATTAPSPSPSHGHSTLVTTAQSAQGHPHISAPIPEFDWSASGLINPLTETTEKLGSVDLDLEYIEEISTKLPPSKQQASISELEVEFLSEPPPPPLLPLPPLTPSVLGSPSESHCISANKTEPDDSVMFSVKDVLSHLPDFSYVRKSTLMFPVIEATDVP